MTEALNVFNTSKSEMLEPPLLPLPQPYRPHMIGIDAPAYALGPVLLQKQNGINLNK